MPQRAPNSTTTAISVSMESSSIMRRIGVVPPARRIRGPVRPSRRSRSLRADTRCVHCLNIVLPVFRASDTGHSPAVSRLPVTVDARGLCGVSEAWPERRTAAPMGPPRREIEGRTERWRNRVPEGPRRSNRPSIGIWARAPEMRVTRITIRTAAADSRDGRHAVAPAVVPGWDCCNPWSQLAASECDRRHTMGANTGKIQAVDL